MIVSLLHDGAGLGNQLHSYLMGRIVALDKGYDFGFVGNFKGDSFMKLERGKKVEFPYHVELPAGKIVLESPWPLFQEKYESYDFRIRDIKDNTVIDGYWQGEGYFEHRRKEIDEWLKVEPLELPDDLCIIGFRGGEYVYTNWFLPKEYWERAVNIMKGRGVTKFRVVTDDPATAARFFPGIEITHEIGMDWRQVRFAKNLIIANSSFFILPTFLNRNIRCAIAPMRWAGYNTDKWHLSQNIYKGLSYLDKDGKLYDYDACLKDLEEYNIKHGK